MKLIGKSKSLKHGGKEEAEEREEIGGSGDPVIGKATPYRGSIRMNADRKNKTFNHSDRKNKTLPLIDTDETDRKIKIFETRRKGGSGGKRRDRGIG